MSIATDRLPSELGDWEGELGPDVAVRREPREDVVRIVEYSPFPRVSGDQRQRTGFTRDVSDSGMCLGVDAAEPVGSLLRAVVRDIDGRSTLDSLTRVEWCRRSCDGRWWLGLSLLANGLRRLPKHCGRGLRSRGAADD